MISKRQDIEDKLKEFERHKKIKIQDSHYKTKFANINNWQNKIEQWG